MSEIVRICKNHGELTIDKVTTNNRCLKCLREYSIKYRINNPEKVKENNKKHNETIKEFKKNGYKYRPIRENKKYSESRKNINCKNHGLVEGKDLIIREGVYLRCRLCAYERNRSWEKRNPDKVKAQKRRTYLKYCDKYTEESILRQKKITKEQYYNLINTQNNKCAICNNKETKISRKDKTISPLCIDHDHKTGIIRGLLCNSCNRGLGFFKDSINFLNGAVKYLEGHQNVKK